MSSSRFLCGTTLLIFFAFVVYPCILAPRVEKEEASLKKKLAIVLNDKQMIEETITTLDVKKKEALQRTWEKVNRDFGAIFGDLLPGNSAKLDAPEGQDISQGLEIKVNLGGVWKQSLTELSGGQRYVFHLSFDSPY